MKQEFDEKEKIVNEVVSCFNSNSNLISSSTFAKAYGEFTEKKILYKSNKGILTYIFPLHKDSKIASLLLVTDKNELYLLKRTTSLAMADVLDTHISPHVTGIFDLEPYLLSEVEFEDIEKLLKLDFEIKHWESNLIIEEKSDITRSIALSRTDYLVDFCEDGINLILPSYANFFNLPLVSPFNDILYNSLSACHPNNGYCVCPTPTCVLEYLMAGISDPEIDEQLQSIYAVLNASLSYTQQSYVLNDPSLLADVGDFLLTNELETEAIQ